MKWGGLAAPWPEAWSFVLGMLHCQNDSKTFSVCWPAANHLKSGGVLGLLVSNLCKSLPDGASKKNGIGVSQSTTH